MMCCVYKTTGLAVACSRAYPIETLCELWDVRAFAIAFAYGVYDVQEVELVARRRVLQKPNDVCDNLLAIRYQPGRQTCQCLNLVL